jgi:hypothetical protein
LIAEMRAVARGDALNHEQPAKGVSLNNEDRVLFQPVT